MLVKLKSILCYFFLVVVWSCQDDPVLNLDGSTTFDPNAWLVPKEEVIDGGSGRDGIPSIDAPEFSPIEASNPVFDDRYVLALSWNGVQKIYPTSIMEFHEIVNDDFNGEKIAVTFCPLTETGIGWRRQFGNRITTFGVSGLLYNSNLMPYDRRTNSIWSQQKLECVNGTLVGQLPSTYNMVMTTLATARKAFPEALILNPETGFDRAYGFSPYGDNYRTEDNRILFPISIKDDRLNAKAHVLGVVIDGQAKAYRFPVEEGIQVMEDTLQGRPLTIIRSTTDLFMVAFYNEDSKLFYPLADAWPGVFRDDVDNIYNITGEVIQGPSKGQVLSAPPSFIGFWFAWSSFYEGIDLDDR